MAGPLCTHVEFIPHLHIKNLFLMAGGLPGVQEIMEE
jgi:hypothetical protein